MEIRFKKLDTEAIMPKKATDGSAAYDLVVPRDTKFSVFDRRKAIPLGFAIALPEGYEAKIEPRSGMSLKGMAAVIEGKETRVNADVMVGKIDSDYRGNVNVIVRNNCESGFVVESGTRIAQMTIYKVESAGFVECEELDDTERGNGGFGHSGVR